MTIAVPMIEEVFNRSLLLRSLHRPRETWIGLMQFLIDTPLLGEKLIVTRFGQRISDHPPVFGREFQRTSLGELSVFGVAASTIVFAAVHAPVDWPGCILCGLVWCLLLRATRDKGLGPVIWSHAITNALLWLYVVTIGDWRFI